MKKSELKKIIKECVKEVLFEEGILSSLVAEVAFGISKAQNQILEQNSTPPQQDSQLNITAAKEEKRKKLLETKRKMIDAMGNKNFNSVFEGTEPLPQPSATVSAHSPLSGKDPNDAGVDISGLFSLAGNKWNQLK